LERDWEKLRKWIVRRRLEGMRVSEICAQGKISRKVFYFWWNRYVSEGWIGLQEKQRGRPQGLALNDTLKQKVVKLRERYEWGPNKIAGHLSHKGFTIDHNQVYQIICQAGLNHPITEPRKIWGTKRFEREHCNSLW
jgi:transposase